jgi:hypothetical protein
VLFKPQLCESPFEIIYLVFENRKAILTTVAESDLQDVSTRGWIKLLLP